MSFAIIFRKTFQPLGSLVTYVHNTAYLTCLSTKNFIRPIFGVTFSKNIPAYYYSHKTTNFKCRIFIIISTSLCFILIVLRCVLLELSTILHTLFIYKFFEYAVTLISFVSALIIFSENVLSKFLFWKKVL